MKNIMRRTVAFMLMACLLLSVIAPMGLFKAEAAEGTQIMYDFACDPTLAYDSWTAGAPITASGNAELFSWSTVTNASHKGNFSISVNALQARKSASYYVAVKFKGIPDKDALYTFDMLSFTSHNAYTKLYLFPGNATAAQVADFTSGQLVMTTGNTANAHSYQDVLITADMVVDNSVIMVINATEGSWNIRLASLALTEKLSVNYSHTYNFGHHTQLPHTSEVFNVMNGYPGYDTADYNWKPLAHSKGEENNAGTHYYSSTVPSRSGAKASWDGIYFPTTVTPGHWIALKFRAPAAGTYNVNLGIQKITNGSPNSNAFIIPYSAIENEADTVSAITNAIAGDANPYLCKDSEDAAIKMSFYGSGSADVDLGSLTVAEAGTEYVLVVQVKEVRTNAAKAGYVLLRNLVLSTDMSTLNSAMNLATSEFDTVKLLQDTTVDALNIGTGATLDLNGYNVTGTVNITDGNLIDTVGTGTVSNIAAVETTNKAVIVKDGEAYRALSYTAQKPGYKLNAETGALEFWFDADFAEDAYALLTSANGVTINAELKVNGESKAIIGLADKVQNWIDAKGVYTDATVTDGNGALCISVTGFETRDPEDVITLTPVFRTEAGNAGVFGGEISCKIGDLVTE